MGAPLRVTVVGGGIAGLAAAHRLVELCRRRASPLDVTLLEAGPRLGGTIRTEQIEAPAEPTGGIAPPGRLLLEVWA